MGKPDTGDAEVSGCVAVDGGSGCCAAEEQRYRQRRACERGLRKSPLVLSADKTRFRIGRGEAVELTVVSNVEQTGGGSSDMVCTVMEYDYGCNKERAKKLSIEDIFENPSNGYRDVPTMYCHFVEQNLETLIADYWNDYPSFVGEPEFEPVAEFFSNAVHVGALSGDFTMQISDYTDLPAELEKLEP